MNQEQKIRNLSKKYGKKLLNTATKLGINTLKTATKKVIRAVAEATGKFLGNKISDKITKPDNNLRIVEEVIISLEKEEEY